MQMLLMDYGNNKFIHISLDNASPSDDLSCLEHQCFLPAALIITVPADDMAVVRGIEKDLTEPLQEHAVDKLCMQC